MSHPTMQPQRAVAAARRAVPALLGCAVMGLAVTTLLSLLGRHGWLLDLLTFARQHLIVIGLALAGAGLLARRRAWATAAAVCAALNLALAVPLTQIGPSALATSAAAAGPQVRVLTLNLLADNYRAKRVLRYLRATDADIVALQELTPYWARKLADLQDVYPYVTPPLLPWRSTTVILSKHPFVEANVLRAPPGTVTGKWNRPLRAVVDVAGQRVAVHAVHPETPRSPEQWEMRNRYLAWLGQKVQRLDGDRPRIVLGDFNAAPWSPFLQDFEAATGTRQAAAGLRWPTRQPLILAPHLSWLGAPVDHVLLSPELEAAEFGVGRDVRSDHLPVLADIRLPATRHAAQSSAASPAR
jgi:endonuclease/exonuclease/phosphatase (EEP) superfamily protein YafD